MSQEAAIYEEVEELRAELKEALDILRWLHDLQNGCPLEKYRTDWEREMARAIALLKKRDM